MVNLYIFGFHHTFSRTNRLPLSEKPLHGCPTPERIDEKGEIRHHLPPHLIYTSSFNNTKPATRKTYIMNKLLYPLHFTLRKPRWIRWFLFFNNKPRICEPQGHVLGRCRSQQFGRLLRLRHGADDLQRPWPRGRREESRHR